MPDGGAETPAATAAATNPRPPALLAVAVLGELRCLARGPNACGAALGLVAPISRDGDAAWAVEDAVKREPLMVRCRGASGAEACGPLLTAAAASAVRAMAPGLAALGRAAREAVTPSWCAFTACLLGVLRWLVFWELGPTLVPDIRCCPTGSTLGVPGEVGRERLALGRISAAAGLPLRCLLGSGEGVLLIGLRSLPELLSRNPPPPPT
mmetsp:Transcript_62436/g.161182  ORF Transcript_62436/g.161182 Transcript_62436/m.161182 type:complete len:210 (+) Transcript_62436:906-1535(+)